MHQERLDTVARELLNSGAASVIDLGCGHGELLQNLCTHEQFEHLIGIDIDERALASARLVLGLDLLTPNKRLAVRYGSFQEMDSDLAGFDAAVMLETIEHINPSGLSKVERAVFSGMRPRAVLITTPNQEYNVLHGMSPGQRRHPGHRFEWTRAQFQLWSLGVAERNDYKVSFTDLGPADALRGSSTQMARFTANDASSNKTSISLDGIGNKNGNLTY
ncbi:MAG: methyltransferase domain-containing protein [Nitrosomonas sp.]|nr:methyltransferase domain-containing protein [Nitrosomonas sp.]MDP1950403.1 methyltransferase domain-containing protein [Nitrosomonas sp.]